MGAQNNTSVFWDPRMIQKWSKSDYNFFCFRKEVLVTSIIV